MARPTVGTDQHRSRGAGRKAGASQKNGAHPTPSGYPALTGVLKSTGPIAAIADKARDAVTGRASLIPVTKIPTTEKEPA